MALDSGGSQGCLAELWLLSFLHPKTKNGVRFVCFSAFPQFYLKRFALPRTGRPSGTNSCLHCHSVQREHMPRTPAFQPPSAPSMVLKGTSD